MSRRGLHLAIGLLAGTVLDAVFADPGRGHPVAAFGAAASALERTVWIDDRVRGAAFTAACVGGVLALGVAGERVSRRWYPVAVAAGTWSVLGAESLRREAAALAASLDASDLDAARARLPHLCGRDPRGLPAAELARAGVESVAENTSDAAVAPLLWGAVAGLPGLLGYRAVNTLDAMVGHRSARYERFGWASARLDDLANLAPSRLCALLTAAVAPAAGGRLASVLRIVRRDGRRHPSPNAGYCEAAFAAALGVRLGGRNDYGDRVEQRPVLGDGRPPGPADLRRAAHLSRLVTVAAAGVAALVAALRRSR